MTVSANEAIRQGRRVTLVGVVVNVMLVGIKFAAGIWGRSQALVADAVHSLSDLFTDLVVIFGLKYGRQAPDEDHPFGHGRIETLASAVVGLALIGVALFIGIEAARGIYRHEENHPAWTAAAAAALSIVSKEILYHYTVLVGRRIKSMSVVANAWHHRSDAFSSVAVLIGVGAAVIQPDWHILDAYAALLVSFFILKVGLDITWQSLKEVVDTAPSPEVTRKIESCARGVAGVRDVHDLRVRSAGGQLLMEIHVVVDGQMTVTDGHQIAKAVEGCLFEEIEDTTRVIIHIDPEE